MGDVSAGCCTWCTLIPSELLICFAEIEFPCRRICLPDIELIIWMCMCFHLKGLVATENNSVVIILKLLLWNMSGLFSFFPGAVFNDVLNTANFHSKWRTASLSETLRKFFLIFSVSLPGFLQSLFGVVCPPKLFYWCLCQSKNHWSDERKNTYLYSDISAAISSALWRNAF